MQVVVRIRPINEREQAAGDAVAVTVAPEDLSAVQVCPRLCLPTQRHQGSSASANAGCQQHVHDQGAAQVAVPSASKAGDTSAKAFQFHGVIPPSCKQADVLRACGITQLLDAALAGERGGDCALLALWHQQAHGMAMHMPAGQLPAEAVHAANKRDPSQRCVWASASLCSVCGAVALQAHL